MASEIERVAGGRFAPGQSGNPGGRPKTVRDVIALSREHTATAIETLIDVAVNGKSEMARVRAAEAILNRAHGVPVLTTDMNALTGDDTPTAWTFDLSGAREVVPLRAADEIVGEVVAESEWS